MMFLLFGTRATVTVLALVRFACLYCGVDAPQEVTKHATKFTLFFVPLVPLGSRFENACTHCGGVTELTREQANQAQEWAARH